MMAATATMMEKLETRLKNTKKLVSKTTPEYISQIPKHLQQFIPNVYDPTANALGYEEDGWFRVRTEMIKEATDYKNVYTKLQGGKGPMKTALEGLQVECKESAIGPNKWLSKLGHGQIIANTYGRPIVFLSNEESCTFLPLRVGPSGQSDPVYLLYVNGNHWVLANVVGKDGVKPILPPILANRVTSKNAKSWLNHIQARRALYCDGITQSLSS
ncbi:hypothetical protein PTTG_29024 [Puccinia triticina 1-1 BBBD Race 1]|uniref:Uncharacterized protein n=1 Tax=Puccinia triticina (isolate 1-1 / race 1 (BBBD)) TaxID=630390 RepID=A0A180G7Z9_PUCT1|nr:hypothetical protein PTTG_29024 [Puccinia triticina 1-1 BBBD Race 1]